MQSTKHPSYFNITLAISDVQKYAGRAAELRSQNDLQGALDSLVEAKSAVAVFQARLAAYTQLVNELLCEKLLTENKENKNA